MLPSSGIVIAERFTEQEVFPAPFALCIAREGIIAQSFHLEETVETPQPIFETPAKKNQTPLIIAAVAIVLCCCCVILAVAGYYGYIRINSSQGLPGQPIEDVEPVIPDDSTIPTFEPSGPVGDVPEGGLGNDILRNDTWQYLTFASMGQGCDQPIAEDTRIDVLQEPQNGVWVEKWTVACASGESYPYEVEFIIDDSGTTFNIKSLPE